MFNARKLDTRVSFRLRPPTGPAAARANSLRNLHLRQSETDYDDVGGGGGATREVACFRCAKLSPQSKAALHLKGSLVCGAQLLLVRPIKRRAPPAANSFAALVLRCGHFTLRLALVAHIRVANN